MKKLAIALFLMSASIAAAETHSLTLAQAVDRALKQNPDLIMARLDEQKAAQQIQVARDPFIPKVMVGSGLAATYGFPLSIEGSAPSLVEARAIAAVINRPARHRLRQAKEEAKGAAIDAGHKRDEIVMRTVELFLEAERAAKSAKTVSQQVQGLERVAETVRARVEEGRELPLELKRAELDVAVARQRVEVFENELDYSESQLASALGYAAGDRIAAIPEERRPLELPASEDAAVARAFEDNVALRRLESSLIAKGHHLSAEKAVWKPTLNVVGKYGLFARFNNYDEFFNKFQRHNGLIGISVEVPVYVGPAAKAQAAQADMDLQRLRTELSSTRSQIALEAKRAYQQVARAGTAVEVARMDLDVSREQLSVLLAKMEEGRASLKEIEAVRYIESEKWIQFYDAHHTLQLARYRLLNETGGLLAALYKPRTDDQ